MLSFDALAARRDLIESSADLSSLLDRQKERAARLLTEMPEVPRVKALYSRDGGRCPNDGTEFEFDPWSPQSHRCPKCGQRFSGARHHAHWARAQHLWIAERAAHLAALAAMTGEEKYGVRSRALLASYFERYFELPNADNVLGPTHLFFSTYLESIWILDYLSAAYMLRELELLADEDLAAIDAIADEAATLIAEFNEGMSNRQTWNSAALVAIGTWFGDEELAVGAFESRTGLLGHLADGFGADGMWFEGENYHLFAMRGLMVGLQWAETAGIDLMADDAIAAHLGAVLMAPATSALPDFTFPARKDSRAGVSLAHPAYVECWESGYAMLGTQAPDALPEWIRALYTVPPKAETTYDAWLHDAGWPLPYSRSRTQLSWWALLTMAPELPAASEIWHSSARLLEQQGLAVMRNTKAYATVECGSSSEGHGHADRLNLTLHANGVHWLADAGTGSYATRDLFWFRSTLAHNAPTHGGLDQQGGAARCVAFAVDGPWQRTVAQWADVTRTVVMGENWLIDAVETDGSAATNLQIPWHFAGDPTITSNGEWLGNGPATEFTAAMERFVPASATHGPVQAMATSGGASLSAWFGGPLQLLRTTGPGKPGADSRATFYVTEATERTTFLVTLLDWTASATALRVNGRTVEVDDASGTTSLQFLPGETAIVTGNQRRALSGTRPAPLPVTSFTREAPLLTRGAAMWSGARPALDGTLAGFNRSEPLTLNEEHQYFRSEAAYASSDDFSAVAYLNWGDDEIYLAVEVTKPELIIPTEVVAKNFDNEPDDINTDSVQVYWRKSDGAHASWFLRPADDGTLVIRSIGDESSPRPVGAWQKTTNGYRVTATIACPGLSQLRHGSPLRFDLIVNEMRSNRERRAGQMVWSGGPGWVYLRGDRHDPVRFGVLELIG